MSEDSVVSAKCRILDLFCELNDFELDTIEQWICSHSYKKGTIQLDKLQKPNILVFLKVLH